MTEKERQEALDKLTEGFRTREMIRKAINIQLTDKEIQRINEPLSSYTICKI